MQVVAQNNNEGVTATRCLSPFSLFREKHEKHNFRQFSKYVFFLAKMNWVCLKIVNSGDFAMILLL